LSGTLGDGDDRILGNLGFHGWTLKVSVRPVKPWKKIIGMNLQGFAGRNSGPVCCETGEFTEGYWSWTQ
jgi:hypothetical protein